MRITLKWALFNGEPQPHELYSYFKMATPGKSIRNLEEPKVVPKVGSPDEAFTSPMRSPDLRP